MCDDPLPVGSRFGSWLAAIGGLMGTGAGMPAPAPCLSRFCFWVRPRAVRALLPDGAAVDDDVLAGDPLAAVADEEEDHFGALGAVAGVAEGDTGIDGLLPELATPQVVHPEGVDDP